MAQNNDRFKRLIFLYILGSWSNRGSPVSLSVPPHMYPPAGTPDFMKHGVLPSHTRQLEPQSPTSTQQCPAPYIPASWSFRFPQVVLNVPLHKYPPAGTPEFLKHPIPRGGDSSEKTYCFVMRPTTPLSQDDNLICINPPSLLIYPRIPTSPLPSQTSLTGSWLVLYPGVAVCLAFP